MITVKKRRKLNPLLMTVIVVSLVIHLVGLAIFGGWIIYEWTQPTEIQFDEAPQMEAIDPQRLEYSVQMSKQTQRTTRPQQRITVTEISAMNIPDVDVQVPQINQRVATNPGGFGGGFGGGVGGGGNLGIGGAAVSLLGITAKTERVLFVIDTDPVLMRDEKGGMWAYNVIKKEILDIINSLPSGILFNIMLYNGHVNSQHVNLFRPQLVPASGENKRAAEQWLIPVNTDPARLGPGPNNFKPEAFIEPVGPHLRNDFWAFQAALEQKPDTIYVLSGNWRGFDSVRRPLSEREQQDFQKRVEDWEKRWERIPQADREAYEKAVADAQAANAAANRRAREAFEAANKARVARGLPPEVGVHGHEMLRRVGLSHINERQAGLQAMSQSARNRIDGARPTRPHFNFEPRQVERHFEELKKVIFDADRLPRPSTNVIVFLGADEEWTREQDRITQRFASINNGQRRVIQGLGRISATTDAEKLKEELEQRLKGVQGQRQ